MPKGYLADIDNDGLADFITTVPCSSNPGVSCANKPAVWFNRIKTLGAWVPDTGPLGAPGGGITSTLPAVFGGTVNFGTNGHDQIIDMNGDGQADLVRFGPGDYGIEVAYGSSSGWSLSSLDYTSIEYSSDYSLLDINRDGLPDLVWRGGATQGLTQLNTGTTQPTNGSVWQFSSDTLPDPKATADERLMGDVDGDGYYDIVEDYLNGSNDAPLSHQEIDFGDGFGFLSGLGSSYLLTLEGFTAPATSVGGEMAMADINGDGLADLLVNHIDGTEVLVNTGSNWVDPNGVAGWQESAGTNPMPPYNTEFSGAVQYLDVNGDGLTDIVAATDAAPDQPTGSLVSKTWLNTFRPPVITNFPNGLASPTVVDYSVITTLAAKTEGVYSDSNNLSAGTSFLETPLNVVQFTTADSGQGGDSPGVVTSYQYGDLRGSTAGRGPQGFGYVSATDPSGITTTTTYGQSYPYSGLATSVTRSYKPDGTHAVTIAHTQTQYCAETTPGDATTCLAPGASVPPQTALFTFPQSITDVTYLVTGGLLDLSVAQLPASTTTSNFAYDDQGNPTNIKIDTRDPTGETWEKTTINEYGDLGTTLRHQGKLLRSTVSSQELYPVASPARKHVSTSSYAEVNFFQQPQINQPGTINVFQSTLALAVTQVEPGSSLEKDTAYAYDEFGNVITTTLCASNFASCVAGASDPSFRTTRVSYNPADFVAPSGDNLHAEVDYDRGEFPVRTINAVGQTEYTVYDEVFGNLLQKTGPNGITSCYGYDLYGNKSAAVSRCGTAGAITTLTSRYAAPDKDATVAPVVTVTRPPDGATTFVYTDVYGRSVEALSRNANGGFTEAFTTYDALGRISAESKPFLVGDPSYAKMMSYDGIGRVSQVTDDLGDVDNTGTDVKSIVTTTYQQIDNAVVNQGATIVTERSVAGDVERTIQVKNALGKLASVKDANQNTMLFSYDADGNLSGTTDSLANTTSARYDIRGNKCTSTDGDMGTWTYGYNGFGELISQTDANHSVTTMAYDALGRLIAKTNVNANGNATTTAYFVYDVAPGAGLGRLAAVVGPPDSRLNGSCPIPYVNVADGDRVVKTFSYSAFGDLQEEASCSDGDTFVTDYAYDGLARRTAVTYPTVDGARLSVGYHYGVSGELQYVTDAADNSTLWAETARNALGQVVGEYTKNGVQTLKTRNPSTGWLMASSSVAQADGDGLIQDWAYTYDEIGNLRTRKRSDATSPTGSTETFGYDHLNRLRHEETSIPALAYDEMQDYQYDAVGNLTQKGANSYAYGLCSNGTGTAGPHAVCSISDGSVFSYDANGNMTSGGSRVVTYDGLNKVVHVERSEGGSQTNTSGAVDFVYDADGNRAVQIAGPVGGGVPTSRTVYVGMGDTGKSLYERTTTVAAGGTSIEHVHFIYAGGAHDGSAFALRVVTDGGSASNETGTKYYHFDHLGSVTAMSDEVGHVVTAAWGGSDATVLGYDAWGARRNPDGSAANPASFNLQVGHREFTGHEAIPAVGLVNMNGRVYDPIVGRFLSADPNVQDPSDQQSYNRYSYVLNNPLRYTDPTGYFSIGGSGLFSIALDLVGVGACVAAPGAGCAAFAVVGVIANATSMRASGASWGQVIAANAISMFAGQLGGGVGNLLVGQAGNSIAASLVGGWVGGAVGGAISTYIAGGNLGWNILSGAYQGELWGAIGWGANQAAVLDEANQAEAQGGGGSGAAQAERAAQQDAAAGEDTGDEEGNGGRGDTRFRIHPSRVSATEENGRIASVDVTDPSIDVRTTYGKGVDPDAPSAYGRGTTDEDVAAGNTSLRFHESQHRADYQQYVDEHPLPTPDVEVGMSVRDFRAALRDYQAEIRDYATELRRYSYLRTDCVGSPKAGCP